MKRTVLLFDFNNLATRTFFVKDVGAHTPLPEFPFWRFMTFDAIYKALFRVDNVSEIVLAVDDRLSWRKLYFKRYKESRKGKREKSTVNWELFFAHLSSFTQAMKDCIPFKVLQVKNAEADDIIGVLALHGGDKYYIISNDEDFLQLSDRSNVVVYNPNKAKEVSVEDSEDFIIRKSLIGQPKDDIFNIITPLDWGQTEESKGKRKPGFGPAKCEKVMKEGYEFWLKRNGLEERYKINRNLIDFQRIPKTIQGRIMKAYGEYEYPIPEKIYPFCKKMGFREYLDEFTKFENMLMRLY